MKKLFRNKKTIILIAIILAIIVIVIVSVVMVKNKKQSITQILKETQNINVNETENIVKNNMATSAEKVIDNTIESENVIEENSETTTPSQSTAPSTTTTPSQSTVPSQSTAPTTTTTPSQSTTNVPFSVSKKVRNTSMEATIISAINSKIATASIENKGSAISSTSANDGGHYFTYRNTAQIQNMIDDGVEESWAASTYYIYCEDVYMWDSSGTQETLWHTDCYVRCRTIMGSWSSF